LKLWSCSMAKIKNRLSDSLAKLSSIYVNDFWQTIDLSYEVDGSSELFEGFSDFKQLKIELLNNSTHGTLFKDDIQLFQTDINSPMVFLFAVKMPSGGTVTCTITDVNEVIVTSIVTVLNLSQSDAVINAPGVLSPQWNIFRSDTIELPPGQEVPAMNIAIEFEPTNSNEPFYFTTPALYPAYEFAITNIAVPIITSLLPNVISETDFYSETKPDLPIRRLIDVAYSGLGDSMELTQDFAYIDKEEGFLSNLDNTKSTLVNSSIASLETLIWLCKFTGTQPLTRFIFSPEFVGDAFVLNTSNLNSDNQIRLTGYTELNPPLSDVAFQKTFLRWQLDTGYYGKNAGSMNSIVEATKLVLINDKTVVAEFDYSTNPFEINIQTKWFETIGAIGPEVVGQSSLIVLESIERARPLGTKITHEYVA